MFAPALIEIIDVITIPGLTLFFGIRLLHFSACAAARARDEKSRGADDFQAGAYVFHIFLVPDALVRFASLPTYVLTVRNRPSTDVSTMI